MKEKIIKSREKNNNIGSEKPEANYVRRSINSVHLNPEHKSLSFEHLSHLDYFNHKNSLMTVL